MADTPFSNSMQDGNYPDAGGAKSGAREVTHDGGSTDLSSPGEQGEAESRGGDHREIQDNGTQGRHFSVGAGGQSSESRVNEPLPKDPHAPPGVGAASDFYQGDYGLREEIEVGHQGNFQANYGMAGEAGGGNAENKGD